MDFKKFADDLLNDPTFREFSDFSINKKDIEKCLNTDSDKVIGVDIFKLIIEVLKRYHEIRKD